MPSVAAWLTVGETIDSRPRAPALTVVASGIHAPGTIVSAS